MAPMYFWLGKCPFAQAKASAREYGHRPSVSNTEWCFLKSFKWGKYVSVDDIDYHEGKPFSYGELNSDSTKELESGFFQYNWIDTAAELYSEHTKQARLLF